MMSVLVQTMLRFPDDDEMDCAYREGCDVADGEPAYAIHLIKGGELNGIPGIPLCATHSPFDNVYVPCTKCGERPCEKPASIEEDPLCQLCK